ncbi:sensor histidine kinase [Hymenobacter mucosus]|uniref:Histidine kinase n=1 Tax=Hymenobacter mucosus TaxID=1411120 RepID=A0A238ZA52_9BACT|nr:histidine kinase [Hymenobacter mucosus]SNR80415.1 Histidine kinase [Hymenobacter mucosus]
MSVPLLPATTRLTGRQKWRVAFSLTLIYYPILVYLNYAHWGEHWKNLGGAWISLLQVLPSVLSGAIVILLVFWGWVHAVEWIQIRLQRRFGEDFSLDLPWNVQLLTVGICIGLSVGFILLFGTTMHLIDQEFAEHGLIVARSKAGAVELAVWRRSLNGYFLMLMLSVFYLLANTRAQQRVRVIATKTQQLETEKAHVQLAALKSQVNPHFLFNSLSILSSLVHVDADLSEKFIDQLSRAYRYTLEQQDHDLVPLQTELAFIQSYTFLLKIRFDEKFDVQLRVPEAARHAYQIAPLTLQLLVENAVKHNTMSQQKPLLVHIELDGEDLVVRNTLQRRPATYASTGVGLTNIHNRYHLLTGRPVQITEGGGEFIVRIPLLSA